jgi:hypothetical protein
VFAVVPITAADEGEIQCAFERGKTAIAEIASGLSTDGYDG